MEQRALSKHILPNSGTMIGLCATLIGLVKLAEGRIGPSRVDEYAALASLLFLVSGIASYISNPPRVAPDIERTLRIGGRSMLSCGVDWYCRDRPVLRL